MITENIYKHILDNVILIQHLYLCLILVFGIQKHYLAVGQNK